MYLFIKVTATYGAWNCEYPCSTCLVHKDSLNKSLHSFQYRTEQIMRKKVVEIENGLTTDKAESAYPVPVVIQTSQLLKFGLSRSCCSVHCGELGIHRAK